MRRLTVLTLAALAVTAVPAILAAQTRPDFSGTWRYSAPKSGEGTEGNSPDMTYPTDLTIKQNATELQSHGSSLRQDDVIALYKFDGTETPVTMAEGITERAKARWDGTTLVVTSRRSFPLPGGGESVSEFEDRWTLEGGLLHIRRVANIDGEKLSRRFIFERRNPNDRLVR